MSTKTSSLNTSANNSPSSPGAINSATSASSAATVVKIKKELPSDEIKEFAESTMNELLGWYGFDSVDRLDISAKTSKILQSAALLNTQQQQQHQQHLERRRSRSSRINALLQMQQHQQQQQQQNEQQHLRSINNNNNNNNNNNKGSTSNNNNNNNNNNNSSCNNNTNSGRNFKPSNRKNSISSSNYRGGGNDSTASDHDTRSSRDDDSKSPNSTGKFQVNTGAITSTMDDKLDFKNCCWCRRPVPENAPEFLTTSDGPRYCSESCFTQSRRASFKKAKTCDWCKHVRHAVSYVDFQDGASQLQFCSDKCLNQYKMQIFCKETQAHLDMNPHLKEQGLKEANNLANLITPDLWLKNCRSRSASPASTMSVSPGPPVTSSNSIDNVPAERTTPTISVSPPKVTTGNNASVVASGTYKPMISVAPVSKLMSKSPGIMTTRQSPKHNRKKRPLKSCNASDMTINNRIDGRKEIACTTAPIGLKAKPLLAPLSENNRGGGGSSALTQFAASCVQDLHMNVPPLSPMMDSLTSQPTTPHSLPSNGGRVGANIPPVFFASPANCSGMQQHTPPPVPPPPTTGYPPRPPFMPAPGGFFPRFLGNFPGLQQPPNIMMPPDMAALNALVGTPPPVTVMVPYPVIIPLPIPIPVPLPVVDFYKAYLTPEERKNFEEQQIVKKEQDKDNCHSSRTRIETSEKQKEQEEMEQQLQSEEPLDFTKTKEAESDDKQKEAVNEEVVSEITNTSVSTTTTEESQASSPKTISALHCVISNDDENITELDESTKLKTTDNINEFKNYEETNNEENNQKLPKLKITRLQTKRTLIQTKESECSRPLRKRKRIIDCDFQKIAAANSKETLDNEEEVQSTSMAGNARTND